MSTARRTHGFRESVIRGMSRLAREHRAINLAQGFPNFAAPELLKEAAARAIRDDINQYAITWGAQSLREAIARKYERWYGLAADPEREITVTCGATEAMISTLLALVDPGDEVIVFEPFYENYGPDTILADARPVYVPLEPGQPARPRAARRGVLAAHARDHRQHAEQSVGPGAHARGARRRSPTLCIRHDALAVTDEIYEHIRFDGEHIPDRDAARHARAHGHDQRRVEDVQRDRLADRLDRGAGRAHRRDPEGARLPHRRRARAAAGGRRGRARRAAGRVLRRARGDVPRQARPAARGAGRGAGFRCLRPRAPTTSWRTSPGWPAEAGGRRSTTRRSPSG